jgi:hypothetical protein
MTDRQMQLAPTDGGPVVRIVTVIRHDDTGKTEVAATDAH